MYHFFAEHENISDDYIDIRGGDVNHIKNVIRLKAGDEVLISSGDNYDYLCSIERISDDVVTAKIIETREKAKGSLTKLGFTFPDSKANFIFATHKSVPAKEIFEKLKAKKIYVRYFNQPGIDNYLRISVGTDEQMDKLIQALSDIVA